MQDQLIKIIHEAARAAGQVHKKYFNSDKLEEQIKKNESYNKVTVSDIEAEEQIVKIIRSYFPDHNILGEEGKYEKTDSEYTWIVDPLDGTNNFASGIPIFGVSIAVANGKEVVAGAVYDPTRDEMFWAQKDKGAFINDKPIKVSNAQSLQEAILITGFYYDRGSSMVRALKDIQTFFENNVVGIRRLGAASLDLCYVAAGRVGGFWEFTLHPWDFAAGNLIVAEAGGKVTNLQGEPVDNFDQSYIVSSNGKIHESMLQVLQ